MSITLADRIRIRELWHAYAYASIQRAGHAQLEEVLGRGKEAADALYAVVSAVLQAEASTTALRMARDRAAAEVREAAVASVHRLDHLVRLAATCPLTGKVIDQPAINRLEAKFDEFLPQGQPSRLALGGFTLQLQAELVRDLLGGEEGCEPLAENLDGLVSVYIEAMACVNRETELLARARKELAAARTHADDMRRAGQHFVQFLQSWNKGLLEADAVYPVSERTRARAPEEALVLLDGVGAPDAAESPAEAPDLTFS